jgi:putative flippase GtrA
MTVRQHVKRLVHRAPIRFGISGGVVGLLYISLTTLLLEATDLPDQIALATAYFLAVMAHFSLNRQFVFAAAGRSYHLGVRAQSLRYITVILATYAMTSLSLAVLPDLLDIRTVLVYLVSAIGFGVANFLVMRAWVFRASSPPAAPVELP